MLERDRPIRTRLPLYCERRFTLADVATVVRLTKTADVWIQSRTRTREPAYEALRPAGRTNWRACEPICFYCTVDGATT